jgi:hypothetical protein
MRREPPGPSERPTNANAGSEQNAPSWPGSRSLDWPRPRRDLTSARGSARVGGNNRRKIPNGSITKRRAVTETGEVKADADDTADDTIAADGSRIQILEP